MGSITRAKTISASHWINPIGLCCCYLRRRGVFFALNNYHALSPTQTLNKVFTVLITDHIDLAQVAPVSTKLLSLSRSNGHAIVNASMINLMVSLASSQRQCQAVPLVTAKIQLLSKVSKFDFHFAP